MTSKTDVNKFHEWLPPQPDQWGMKWGYARWRDCNLMDTDCHETDERMVWTHKDTLEWLRLATPEERAYARSKAWKKIAGL